MSDAHKLFLQENENIKISKRTFENGRPKNKAQKGCLPTYLRKILNQVFVNNNEDISLKTSADLVNISFCSFENISCVVGECQVRKSFTKLDELNIDQAHCSKNYFLENVNCSEEGHTTKFKQF